jgi:hypothetical protein
MSAPNDYRQTKIHAWKLRHYVDLSDALARVTTIIEGPGTADEKLSTILSTVETARQFADPICRICGGFAGRMYHCDDCRALEDEERRGGS